MEGPHAQRFSIRSLSVGIVCALLLGLALLLLPQFGTQGGVIFSSAEWHEGDRALRGRMAIHKDFQGRLLGRSPADIRVLLGNPDGFKLGDREIDSAEWFLYLVSVPDSVLAVWLDIHFEHNEVRSVTIENDSGEPRRG